MYYILLDRNNKLHEDHWKFIWGQIWKVGRCSKKRRGKHYIFPTFSSSSSLILRFVANSKRMSLRVQELMQELSQYNKPKAQRPKFCITWWIICIHFVLHQWKTFCRQIFGWIFQCVSFFCFNVAFVSYTFSQKKLENNQTTILFSYCSSCTLENMITNLEKFNFFSI